MSDYTKVYDGATLDSGEATLAGADFDVDFAAIEVAVATKTDKAVPTLVNSIGLLDVNGNLLSSEIEISTDGTAADNSDANVMTEKAVVTYVAANGGAPKGCLVYKSSLQTVAGSSSFTPLTFNTGNGVELYDTDACHDMTTNGDRLTVPAGFTRIKVSAGFYWSGFGYEQMAGTISKGGSTGAYIGMPWAESNRDSGTASQHNSLNLQSGILTVTAGEFFRFEIASPVAGWSTQTNSTWFQMELLA